MRTGVRAWLSGAVLTLHGIDELRARTGTELGVSAWHSVTQERVTAFADATDDHTRIHVDPEYARGTRLGGTIAHGLYTLSLGPKFLHEIYSLAGVSLGLNYGYDRIRLIAPVPTGSQLRMRATLASATPIEGGTRFAISEVFEIEGADKPACVADAIVAYFD